MFFDSLVHQRLRVTRFIGFVVAEFSKADSAMQQDWQGAIHRFMTLKIKLHNQRILTRACHSFNNGIDGFEVTWIWRECQTNFFPAGSLAFAGCALMIFYVAFVSGKRWMNR